MSLNLISYYTKQNKNKQVFNKRCAFPSVRQFRRSSLPMKHLQKMFIFATHTKVKDAKLFQNRSNTHIIYAENPQKGLTQFYRSLLSVGKTDSFWNNIIRSIGGKPLTYGRKRELFSETACDVRNFHLHKD